MGDDKKTDGKNGQENPLFVQVNSIVDATSTFIKTIFPPAFHFVGKIKYIFKPKKSEKKEEL